MQRGFSLVELSIVLVILGLLTGGILAGQSLIRASELRAVSTEFQRYQAAVNAFRDKYFAFPGDMNNAVSFWGAAAACPSVLATAPAGVCNGDGDGNINPAATNSNEMFGFWEHLASAGLIEGSYTGAPNSATAADTFALIGTNVPRSRFPNSGWSVNTLAAAPISSTIWFEGSYGNVFYFGGSTGVGMTHLENLRPEEAWNIDTKLDDGKPGTGSMYVAESDVACHDAGTSNSVALAGVANYNFSNTAPICTAYFKINR